MKFGRTYQLTIQTGDIRTGLGFAGAATVEALVINYPLTLSFDVQRNTLASANRATLRILNLAPDTRRQIFHDRNQTLDYKQIRLQAGYEGQSPLPTIFQGNIMQAYSFRDGTNWVTEIEAFDGGFGILNGQVSQTVPKGWDLRQIIKSVITSLPRIGMGAVSDIETGSSRGITLMGNSWDTVSRLAAPQNATAFVDNEQANVLAEDDYLADADSLALLSAETGLLQTPRRSNALLEVTVLFEPRLQVGQKIALQSLEAVYNGDYKILGVAHRGTISGAVSDTVTTVASLSLGTGVLNAVPRAA